MKKLGNQSKRPLKIAILGTRGIPARYGGFETFAEELSTRLVTRGHELTVYRRHTLFSKRPQEEIYRGVRLVSAPTVMHKYLETPLHAFFSFLDLLSRDYDAVLLCNAANSPFAWLCNLRRVPIAINVDGIERKRAKWNALGRAWYLLGERCSIWFADRVIADAKVISDYYAETYRQPTTVIAYGASAVRRPPGGVLSQFNLEARGYILYVSRLEPENNALGVISAYVNLPSSLQEHTKLVIVGDAPYAEEYKAKLREAANSNVIFTGYQFAEAYQELQSNCLMYVQATEVGGTHPALIEAMAYGNCVIANGSDENREVLAEAGEIYRKNDFAHLTEILERLLSDEKLVSELGSRAAERASALFNWEVITDQYEKLFYELARE